MTVRITRPARWRWWATVRGFVRRHRAELAVAVSASMGWGLLTAAAAITFGAVWWLVGAGLYLIALAGVRYIAEIAWVGLYMLARHDDV